MSYKLLCSQSIDNKGCNGIFNQTINFTKEIRFVFCVELHNLCCYPNPPVSYVTTSGGVEIGNKKGRGTETQKL